MEKKYLSIEEIERMEENGTLVYHHTAYFRGYVYRTIGAYAEPYKGRFGEGYVVRSPNYHSTTYSYISYYVYPDSIPKKKR